MAPATRNTAPKLIPLGDFKLDRETGELRKGDVKIRLQEQPLKILELLLEHPGELVSREQIQHRLWPDGTVVEFEHSVHTAVKRLREALADCADAPRYIETIPRRGYRLIVSAQTPQRIADPGLLHILRGWRFSLTILAVSGLLLVAGVAARQWRTNHHLADVPVESLAVLPLDNLSGNPEEEYFADGLTETLITELGKLHSLRVISRQSVMQYKNTSKTVPEIAKELNIDALVEGAVLRVGNKVRITAQLVRVNPERHVWSQSYERDLSGVISLQGELTQAIARESRVTLTPQERAGFSARRPVNNEAYDAYLRGLFHWSKRTADGLRKSGEYFPRNA